MTHTPNSISQTLVIPLQAAVSSPSWYTQARFRHRDSKSDESNNTNRDPHTPPKLFVVQPKIRPDTVLKLKLQEALNLADSLEEQRDGYYAATTHFNYKDLPSHLVVQNPAARTTRAGLYIHISLCLLFVFCYFVLRLLVL